MTDHANEQEIRRWKQQYYDHIDLLERKERDWCDIESILIKAVLRLSIAAEGQHPTVDRHLQNVRSLVKQQINVSRLDQLLEDISALLLKIGDKPKAGERKSVSLLLGLLENLELPAALGKQKNTLLKQLARSSDKNSADLALAIQNLLTEAIRQSSGSVATPRAKTGKGWFGGLFGASEPQTVNPDEAESDAVIELGDRATSPEAKVASASVMAMRAAELSPMVGSAYSDVSSDVESEPSVREILIRLLEQLIVPSDLQADVASLKKRIEDQSSDPGWKQLLRDVVQLINTLRSRMQEEKMEFESFLQQITQRLKEMDGFLEIETLSLREAAQDGSSFDSIVTAQVQDIHEDMNTADSLDDLKTKVEKRLTIVSDHIKQYRVKEQERYSHAQQNVEDMQSRLVMLEQESGELQQLILEKNKEAMHDVLTGIPNRLSYEKKAAEEIARCNRFETPLSMVVWDVDRFKVVNDTYGHKVGDKVLKIIAHLLEDRMRETDFIARYGGEEFVMFLPGADETRALEIANTLREKIAASTFNHNDDVVSITVSCGISSFTKGDNHGTMFERADQALYSAKRNGRNRCVAASSLS